MKRTITHTILALAVAAPVAAQGGAVTPLPLPAQQSFEKHLVENELAIKQTIERARVSVESRITPGAPYSAEALTETVQVLSDGNRIARKTAARVYRDTEGRTRRESLSPSGEVQNVTINDPVAGVMYVLNPASRTASRNSVLMTSPSGFAVSGTAAVAGTLVATRTGDGADATAEAKRQVETQAAAVAIAGGRGRGSSPDGPPVNVATMVYPAEGVTLARIAPDGGTVNKEDLGQQVIEGVLATGTRTTTTIPAGSIGNEQPIQIVAEQWFSPDLKILVMTKHADPRSGETTYRLTNVAQTEPARTLFEVPADYTMKAPAIRRQSPLQR